VDFLCQNGFGVSRLQQDWCRRKLLSTWLQQDWCRRKLLSIGCSHIMLCCIVLLLLHESLRLIFHKITIQN
jgi:hypothetical protein